MIIAIDIGTTHVKAAAFDASAQVIASAERSNETFSPLPDQSEQDPETVLQNVFDVTREVSQKTPEKPRLWVFSSALHGLVAVDRVGQPLTNIWLWSDLRAASEARVLREKPGMELYLRSGVPLHPMSPLTKLIWMRRYLPEVFRNTHKFLGIKEFIWYRLTGRFESDLSCASATGLMHLQECRWDVKTLETAGITAEQLPALVAPSHCAVAENLPDKPIVMIGAGDGPLANLGVGATGPGQACLTIGTSAAFRMLSDQPVLDAYMRTFCYRLDESRFVVGGASNNGGNVLEWLRTTVFQSGLPMQTFVQQAEHIAPGADGLRFVPYLFGERAPIWDPAAKAGFSGISPQHTQAHFIRAAMEGVLWNMKAVAEVLEEKMPVDTIFTSGGIFRNALWINMLSQVFQKQINTLSTSTDASLYGAFLLAQKATKSFSS